VSGRLAATVRGVAPLLGLALLLAGKQVAVAAALGIPLKASIGPGSFAPLLLAAPLLALVPARLQLVGLLALDGAASVLLLSDLVHFRIFGDVASASALAYAKQLGDVAGSVTSSLRATDVLPFVDLPLLWLALRRRTLERPAPLAAAGGSSRTTGAISSTSSRAGSDPPARRPSASQSCARSSPRAAPPRARSQAPPGAGT
jgi:hypothetical protein